MAKALKIACSITSKLASGSSVKLLTLPRQTSKVLKHSYFNLINCGSSTSRAHSTLSVMMRPGMHKSKSSHIVNYSTEVDKDLSRFLKKEVQFENTSSADLPKIPGFEITTEGADVTLTKTTGDETIVVKFSVSGTVDPVDDEPVNEGETPQMASRPPFQVEITRGSTVLAVHCAFPSQFSDFNDQDTPLDRPENEQFGDNFEIQEIAIHDGEWKETTYSVTSNTMDPELFDLLMDMLDEKGIHDEFIADLISFSTAYEEQQYVTFLQNLKQFAEK